MRVTRLGLVLPLLLGLQACAAFTGVTPTNLEPILVGKQRTDVEAVLGSPSETKPNGCGSVDTYAYNRGRQPEPALVAFGMIHPAAPLVVGVISHPFLYYGQKANLDVVYDPHDTVIKYGPRELGEWDSLFANNHLWVDHTTAEDVAAHYHRVALADTLSLDTARHCLCRAARLGHPDSQIYLAEAHQRQTGPAVPPPTLALAGYETAASNADPATISEMTDIETGVIPQPDAYNQPPLLPADLVAGSCGAQSQSPAAKPASSG